MDGGGAQGQQQRHQGEAGHLERKFRGTRGEGDNRARIQEASRTVETGIFYPSRLREKGWGVEGVSKGEGRRG